MIKFFRKIRQNLVMENNTGKYFKYAIGEIILVVIGILIAIQVSNWNETRNARNKTEALFDKFENELELTIGNANNDISISTLMDSVTKPILANKITRQNYIDDNWLRHLSTFRITLNPDLDHLNKLIEKEELLDEKYKEVMTDINNFRYTREREIDYMNRLRISAEENSDYINLNFPWARLKDSISNENAYRYFLTDENYKNRLFNHWQNAMEYAAIINNYRVGTLGILSKLKILREGYSSSELEILFNKLEQRPFERIGKNERITDKISENQIGKSALIVNVSKDNFRYMLKNRKGHILRSGTSSPGEIFPIWSPEVDLFSDHFRIFELYKNDDLIEKYKVVQHGYLLLK